MSKHLAELELKTFRNVRPTRLVFRPGINVVLGKNAAGKTTLLELLAGVLKGWGPSWSEEPFDWSYVVRRGSAELRRASSGIAGTYQGLPGLLAPLLPTDHFEIIDPPTSATIAVRSGRIVIDGEEGVPEEGPPLLSAYTGLRARSSPLTPRLLELAVSSSFRLDESLDYLRGLLARELAHDGSQLAFQFGAPIPDGLTESLVGPLKLEPGGGLRFPVAFLQRAAKVMGYEKGEALLDVESKTTGLTAGTTLRNLRFAFSSGKETIFHNSLSYGEKRLLSFFAAADACPDILVVDELVNGLHHEWIKACLEEIGPRQAFLTSQNPLLLDYLEFSDAEEVARSFIFCERVRTERGTELSWRNPTMEEAQEFFSAYETGIQRVSDILITKGFW